MKLYFLTTNENKAAEATAFFAQSDLAADRNIELRVLNHDVQEIMHPDLEEIVRSKALAAYRYLRQPCVVEHGGLFFDGLPRLPGPMGKLIGNAVGDRMCGFLHTDDSRRATARAILGYCDGRRIRLFTGETRGEVAERARGEYNKSHWDPIFIPEGSSETYAEMGPVREAADVAGEQGVGAVSQGRVPGPRHSRSDVESVIVDYRDAAGERHWLTCATREQAKQVRAARIFGMAGLLPMVLSSTARGLSQLIGRYAAPSAG